jgi:hypothetical protein
MSKFGWAGADRGMTWNRDDKEKTALHEAGHAVVAWSFGVTAEHVYIDLETKGGGVDIAPASIANLTPVEQIANCFAGFEAEQAFKPPGRNAKPMYDCGDVRRILRENGTPEETPEGRELRERGRAYAAARLREHETKVRRVAHHLAEHHHMIDRVAFEAMMKEP